MNSKKKGEKIWKIVIFLSSPATNWIWIKHKQLDPLHLRTIVTDRKVPQILQKDLFDAPNSQMEIFLHPTL